jgi:hypothetical protein
MEHEPTSIRIHISEPGPRAGVPFGISIETVNAGDMTDAELGDEVQAALSLLEMTTKAMQERHAPPEQDVLCALQASIDATKAGSPSVPARGH